MRDRIASDRSRRFLFLFVGYCSQQAWGVGTSCMLHDRRCACAAHVRVGGPPLLHMFSRCAFEGCVRM